MAKPFINKIVKRFLDYRFSRVEAMRHQSSALQATMFDFLLSNGLHTEFGKQYGYQQIKTINDFKRAVPLHRYEDLEVQIKEMMDGASSILWPGKTKWFAKSSGTTSNVNKFIPITKDKLKRSHVCSAWDALSIYYHHRPNAQLFRERSLVLGGTLHNYNDETVYGDVSAIMIHHMPMVAKPFYLPEYNTAIMADWEEKIDMIVSQCINENITMISGVPTWIMVLFKEILNRTGKEHIHEVWPQLSLYLHGGVGFKPYKEKFEAYLPSEVDYIEVYNASEGYFGIRDIIGREDMLLLTDNGVYYEFLPLENISDEAAETLNLEEVELGKDYALVISTCAGLWRYLPGDTIRFTSLNPYRIVISGRTKQYINTFGEELMVSNTDTAIAIAAQKCSVHIVNYTVAPIYMTGEEKGGHQWLIEFENEPDDLNYFADILDKQLQSVNADYAAKRYKDLAVDRLIIESLPAGSFVKWLKQNGKLGAQYKVPRLSNDRKIVDSLLNINSNQMSYV